MDAIKNLFDVKTTNEELEQEFYNFFVRWNLTPLFTDAHRAGTITVTDLDARAVVNYHGAYSGDLRKLGNLMKLGQDNKAYQRAIFSIIYDRKSFRKLMITIREVNNTIEHEIKSEHMYNLWNIVYYTKGLTH